MSELLGVLRELDDPTRPAVPQPLASQLGTFAAPHDAAIDPATALRAILAWSRLHGLVSLEIAGNFHSMGLDPTRMRAPPSLWPTSPQKRSDRLGWRYGQFRR